MFDILQDLLLRVNLESQTSIGLVSSANVPPELARCSRQIVLSGIGVEGQCPYVYNTVEEIDRFLNVLDTAATRARI